MNYYIKTMEWYLINKDFELVDSFDLPENDPDMLALEKEVKEQGMVVTPKHCKKGKCLKEVNPSVYPGEFFGEPFLVEMKAYACFLCLFIGGSSR